MINATFSILDLTERRRGTEKREPIGSRPIFKVMADYPLGIRF